MSRLTLALLQTEVALGNPRANLTQAEPWIARLAAQGAEIALLPELWATGYALERAASLADPLGQGVFAAMARWAQTYGLAVGGSHLERTSAGVYNTFALSGPDGTLWSAYRKIHLFGPLAEARYLSAGDRVVVAPSPWGPLGLAICYDLRFPEIFRLQAVAGARLLLLVAEWPRERIDHWHVLLRARAVENQAFVAAVNRVGQAFGGGSSVVSPKGKLLGRLAAQPDALLLTIDLGRADALRQGFSPLRDRRPEAYRLEETRRHG